MNQYETIRQRTFETKIEVLERSIKQASALFRGMDEKMQTASQNYANSAADIWANPELTTEAKKSREAKKYDEIFRPAKELYLAAIRQAVQICEDGIAEIAAAAKPQNHTGEERAVNVALWQVELSSMRHFDDFKPFFYENADDMDFMRLVKAFSKSDEQFRGIVLETESELVVLATSKKLTNLRNFIRGCDISYIHNMPSEIELVGAGSLREQGVKMTSWKSLENGG